MQTTFSQIRSELETLKIVPYLTSYDKFGSPYVYLNAAKHIPGQFDPATSTIPLVHFVLWNMLLDLSHLDGDCAQLRKGISILIDLSEFQPRNLDNSGLSIVLQAFLNSYPFPLKNIYMLGAPKAFKNNDKLVGQLDPNTAKCIQWVERWTMVIPLTSVPSCIGGKGPDFDLAAYEHRFQPQQPTQHQTIATDQQQERIEEGDNYGEIFGIYHPVARTSASSLLESMHRVEGNDIEQSHSLYFNQEQIDNALQTADQELEQYRLSYNKNAPIPMADVAQVFGSDENLLSMQRYSKWVQGKWVVDMERLDESFRIGKKRFSETDYYEGIAFDRLKESEVLDQTSKINQ